MPALKVRRIDLSANNAAQQLAKLRDQFKLEAEVVSPQSKKLTLAVFGEALPPTRAVERICTDVRDNGLEAVLRYTEVFDKVKLKPDAIRVKESELEAAHAAADPEFLDVLRRIRYNIDSFQNGLMHRDAELRQSGSFELHLRYRPLDRVGVCCPGGAAAYPSTLLMTVCPAQAAGVKEIAVVMPPTATRRVQPGHAGRLPRTGRHRGLSHRRRPGGRRAGLRRRGHPGRGHDRRPGQQVRQPGEEVRLRHRWRSTAWPGRARSWWWPTTRPSRDYVALDLIAQAEHSPGVAILVTWHEPLLDEVEDALEKRLAKLGRADLSRESLERYGAFVLAPDKAAAVECVNELAPEHLHVQTRDPDAFADEVETPGRSSSARSRRWRWATTRPARRTCCRPAAPPGSPAGCRPTTSAGGPASCGSPATGLREMAADVVVPGQEGGADRPTPRASSSGPTTPAPPRDPSRSPIRWSPPHPSKK